MIIFEETMSNHTIFGQVDIEIAKVDGCSPYITRYRIFVHQKISQNYVVYKYIGGLIVYMDNSQTPNIFDLGINRDYRKSGFGRLLLQTVVKELLKDYSKIRIDACPVNPKEFPLDKLVKFYQTLGFNITETFQYAVSLVLVK